MTDEEKKIEVVVRVYIFNKKDELFLIKNPKEKNLYTAPGGHIDFGEKIEDAVKRETKEETGLDIKNLRFLINTEYFSEDGLKHFVTLRYTAELADDSQSPVLQPDEATNSIWINPADALDRADVKETIKKHIKEFFLAKKEKSGFFHKECKNCEKLEKEAGEYKAGWQRAMADYQNLQKETVARRVEWAQMSERQILEEFIPIYENLKLAFQQFTVHSSQFTEAKPLTDGINHILKQFADVMKEHGVEEIKTIGEKFNPNLHEAMGTREPEQSSVQGDNNMDIIIEEVSGGYKMGDKVIKAAKVIIAK